MHPPKVLDPPLSEFIRVRVGQVYHFAAVNFGSASRRLTIVIVPGSGRVDCDGLVTVNRPLLELGKGLASAGYRVVRLSKVSYGEERPPASYAEEYLRPLQAIVQAACVTDSPLVLIGHSLGGHLAPWLSRELATVLGVVMINPGVRPLPAIVSAQSERSQAPRALVDLWGMSPEYEYASVALAYDFASEMSRTCIPVLAVSCLRDNVLPPEERRLLRQAILLGKHSTLYVNRNANHLGMIGSNRSPVAESRAGVFDSLIVKRILEWIKSDVEAII